MRADNYLAVFLTKRGHMETMNFICITCRNSLHYLSNPIIQKTECKDSIFLCIFCWLPLLHLQLSLFQICT